MGKIAQHESKRNKGLKKKIRINKWQKLNNILTADNEAITRLKLSDDDDAILHMIGIMYPGIYFS